LVNNEEKREIFIEQAVEFVKEHNFDGLELDWEYPVCWQMDCTKGPASDREGFSALIKELSRAMHRKNMILSATMSASAEVIDKAYDIKTLSDHLDFVTVMTYDYHGHWDKQTGHLAPLYQHENDSDPTMNINYTVNYLLDNGLAREKLVMAMPLYGQTFTLRDESFHNLNADSIGPGKEAAYTKSEGFIAYYEICNNVLNDQWEVVRDDSKAMGPYAYKGNQWISFDDIDSIRQKMAFVQEMGLAGVMVWAIDLDDFSGSCQGEKFPLLRAINRELGLANDGRSGDYFMLETTLSNQISSAYQSEGESRQLNNRGIQTGIQAYNSSRNTPQQAIHFGSPHVFHPPLVYYTVSPWRRYPTLR